MKNILPAPAIEITRTIKEKIFIISWTWFLLIFVYQAIVYSFIDELNQGGQINFGIKFSPYQMFWGELIFPNILKIIIDVIIALLGGATVGYLLTRVRITFKFFYSFFSTFIQLFLFFFVILFILALKTKGNLGEGAGQALFYIFESLRFQPLWAFFFLLNIASVFAGYYFGINWGMRLKEDNSFGTDRERRDTLLDVKWFHWLWFWIPVGIYLRIILWIVFSSIRAIFEALKGWKILEIFGVTITNSEGESSQSIGGIIFWGFLFLAFFFIQLKFVWDLLTGKKIIKNKLISSILIFLFSFIVPFAILFLLYWLFNRK